MAKPKPRRARRPAPRPKRAAAKTSSSSELSISLDVKALGLEPILGAAYLMMDRAYVFLEGDKTRRVSVVLRAKSGSSAALERAFRAELEAQKLRWAVARNNQGVREYVAENALSLAEEFAARASAAEPAGDQLSASQRAEIERLIAEVETEIAQMNSKQEHADPKKVSLSWEAAREGSGGAPE